MRTFFTTKAVKRGGSMYLLVPASAVKDADIHDGDRVHIILETTWDEDTRRKPPKA